MGRKKIALISYDNSTEFIDYISKKLDHNTTSEFVRLISEAKDTQVSLKGEFDLEYHVDVVFEPEALNEKHKQMLAEICERSFKAVNDLVESTKGLKAAFRNATAQKLYKQKNKYRADSRVVMELGFIERNTLINIRKLCNENDIVFSEQLSDFRYQLEKQIREDSKN